MKQRRHLLELGSLRAESCASAAGTCSLQRLGELKADVVFHRNGISCLRGLLVDEDSYFLVSGLLDRPAIFG